MHPYIIKNQGSTTTASPVFNMVGWGGTPINKPSSGMLIHPTSMKNMTSLVETNTEVENRVDLSSSIIFFFCSNILRGGGVKNRAKDED